MKSNPLLPCVIGLLLILTNTIYRPLDFRDRGKANADWQPNNIKNSMNMETVTSKDGTEIAFIRTGSGPPLLLVHGSAGDHTRWELFDVRPKLAQHFTVYAMDRRGRGGSGDADNYKPDLEFEDIAAVVNSIDEQVTLLGHSYGAFCALGASLKTGNLKILILYEPVFVVGDHQFVSSDVITELKAVMDKGDKEQLLIRFLEKVARIPQTEIEIMRSGPATQPRPWHPSPSLTKLRGS